MLHDGAHDCVTVPCRAAEVAARVRARLRTVQSASTAATRVGRVELDRRAGTCRVDGREVKLTRREFALLDAFVHHPGQVLSRDQLQHRCWDADGECASNIVDVYVGYLRRKLGPGMITTVRRMGYRFDA